MLQFIRKILCNYCIWTSSFIFPLLVLFSGGLQTGDPVRFLLGGQKIARVAKICLFWVNASQAHRPPCTMMKSENGKAKGKRTLSLFYIKSSILEPQCVAMDFSLHYVFSVSITCLQWSLFFLYVHVNNIKCRDAFISQIINSLLTLGNLTCIFWGAGWWDVFWSTCSTGAC